ncbi:MAG: nucleoside triphosphate pyrophosphohydrolase [Planctomycetes bacterium]|nr:nucleoside triphosphate pyrophosphohydrolase [Planctomycetota bacterium]MBI3846594.1 nucleoside triphosphate pyrophosphohydrolase [Planctomycetota bacterium]
MSNDANGAKLEALRRLIETVARLREPGGCPWDRAQTMHTLSPYVLEEAHEVVEAIEHGDVPKIREELGDLLMNVLMLCRMSEEANGFTITEVAGEMVDKLVRRHPHVFGDVQAADVQQVLANWEAIKQSERKAKGVAEDSSALAGVPASMPALLRASRLGEKAARAGFDWPSVAEPLAKVDEEWRELRGAVSSGAKDRIEDELGDTLFALVALARRLDLNAEMALRRTIAKFETRFRFVEKDLGKPTRNATIEELLASWQKAKSAEG